MSSGAHRPAAWVLRSIAGVGLILLSPAPAEAYIGPGAGFVLLSSFLTLAMTAVMALFTLVLWPFRKAWQIAVRPRRGRAWARRVIVVGLDGQDPKLTERFLAEGKLPNFSRLADAGGYRRLRTTFPPVSPVAWSSFSTGTNPGRHNIFDFLDRDPRTYLPALSSVSTKAARRSVRIGRFRVPLERPELRLLRKSKPFWSVLGEHGIWSTILRVPITFPPERFYGAQLSAMSVPDLRGTQGTFTLFTTRPASAGLKQGGVRIGIRVDGDLIDSSLPGPENSLVEGAPVLATPLRIVLDRVKNEATADLGGTRVGLRPGRLSDWITVSFRAAPGIRISGICRLLLLEMGEHVSLYVTPINIDPEKPAMPISHPPFYAAYLSKRLGKFATLGLAEDTWALNDGVIGTDDFLAQAYDIDREREAMFFAGLDRLRSGALVCVFDGTDRIQHMCWSRPDEIEKLYVHNDALVGRVMRSLRPDDLLLVLSDHGFSSFRRGMNVNSWLRAEGYLTLKSGTDGAAEWLRDVDWSRTRAYALGLTGMFLNLKGREGSGIVSPGGEADALKKEIIGKLSGLVDEGTGDVGVTEVFDTASLYDGPYRANAPDLLIGYNAGFRHSWESATGVVAGPIFEDNTKAWSGDHCIDPRLVPGVLFSNRRIDALEPGLLDIAPTALRAFGISPPRYMEGSAIFEFGLQPARPPEASVAG